MDALLLARMQFAANISFHILFPTITIALAWVLLFFKLRFSRSGDQRWMDLYGLWVKIFALTFGLGVVSGIVMSFQFGTNWPGFMETVGNVAGPLLAYEILTAFFLEAVFIGIMLFGRERVGDRIHTAATLLVALGTTASAFWILVLNSWMHTPAGYELRDGIVHAVDWMAIIFNPSMPYRLVHMLLASGLTVAFVVAGLSAWRLLRAPDAMGRLGLKVGLTLAAVLIPLQILAGDLHGLNTLEHQPAKVAAMEGNWETAGGVPLLLFALPDEEARENHFEIGIPNLASLILTHELDGTVPGLNDFVGAHPPVAPVFFAFRIMVGVGMLMLVVSWAGLWLMRQQRLGRLSTAPRPDQTAEALLPRWALWVVVAMTFSGWVATLSGWYVTEIGRQPWLVTGVLTTDAAVGPVAASVVASSFVLYLALYAGLLVAYCYTLFRLARRTNAAAISEGDPRSGLPPTPPRPSDDTPPHALSPAE